jgi:hypothetical protein
LVADLGIDKIDRTERRVSMVTSPAPDEAVDPMPTLMP